ncbi:unnamed protein product [Schistosoma turkestanicum]|nr:unnamed protein product [Schistosoma turkestanicum]
MIWRVLVNWFIIWLFVVQYTNARETSSTQDRNRHNYSHLSYGNALNELVRQIEEIENENSGNQYIYNGILTGTCVVLLIWINLK